MSARPGEAVPAAAFDACWNRIGVHGDATCAELSLQVHCRNCPVYSRNARLLLDRARVDDLAATTRLFAADKQTSERGEHSAFVFRVGPEWLALSTAVLDEVADLRQIHGLPHRRSGVVLGVANVRGELIVCVSLAQLLGIEPLSEDLHARGQNRVALRRLLVVRERGLRLAFPVDEVHGTQRYDEAELKPAPSTVARATASYSRALLPWEGHAVGLLDEELLFHSLNRNLGMSDDLSQFSMHDLFRLEVEGQREVLTSGLLALERDPGAATELEACMRSAHSLKGAARIVGLSAAVVVAHAMEDAFVAAQQGALRLDQARIDLMLRGLDLLVRVANTPEAEAAPWQDAAAPAAQAFVADLAAALAAPAAVPAPAPASQSGAVPESTSDAAPETTPARRERRVAKKRPRAEAGEPAPERRSNVERNIVAAPVGAAPGGEGRERTLKVAAQNLNRLLGLSGEALVESRWVAPFAESLLRLKRMQVETTRKLAQVQERLPALALDERTQAGLSEVRSRMTDAEGYLAQRLEELELYDQRSGSVARRLYDEAIASRMRPFRDRTGAFPRLVRDLGHELHKRVQLLVLGEDTQVDRDVLEKLEAPLSHLLRNAVDHGMETEAERLAAGKPAEGRITLEARHAAGMLQISVGDDGRGIDLERVRATVVQRGLSSEGVAAQLTEAELLEFLFLPGFTVRETVTEISGRGVGLDAVQDMVKQLRGSLRVSTEPGRGARFQMHLPLTVSVVRALVVEIAGEPYAFPLAFISNTASVPRERIQVLEGRQHVDVEGRQVGLVAAVQVLGGHAPALSRPELPVVVIGDHGSRYGLVVDRFLGVRELVVQPLDLRLGKIKDISAGALLDNGTPVLIVDTFDLLRSIDKLIATGHLEKIGAADRRRGGPRRKRVLVVEDSLTVRELERKLIESGGFEVEVAVDGADGWNAVRVGHFDLVVTDVDMPRMDGIALVAMIKQDPRLAHTPVMIVSYKDREEDRRRGLEAGADFYLTKGSFHDETLLQAVHDLVGDAMAQEAP